MSRVTVSGLSAGAAGRLEELRGGAQVRSPNVRALAAFAENSTCALASLAFAAGVDLDRLLVGTPFQAPFGQSPFAFQRGLQFEQRLRENGHAATLALLREGLGDPMPDPRVVNLRERHPKNSEGMRLRHDDTRELLRLIVQGSPGAPNLIDGAVLQASVGGVVAHFEADALAALSGGQVRVAEVKSYPKVDDRIDADKLGAALDQVAIYVILARHEVAALGGDPEALVSDVALLITPRNVGMQPTLSSKGVGPRVARAARLLCAVPRLEDVVASIRPGLSFGPAADRSAGPVRRLESLHVLADAVGTTYRPECLASCGNARFCRDRAFRAGDPALLGACATRAMPGLAGLARAAELASGAPAAAGEGPAAELLARAGRIYDAAFPVVTAEGGAA